VRAHQTAAYICEGLNIPTTDLVLEPRIYGAQVEDLIAIIGNCPGHMSLCMLVGHNPGLEELVRYLVGGGQPEPDYNKVMPTAGIYLLEVGNSWTNLQSKCAQIVASMRPKSL
jgi:phosphohistidine phosphatase